MKRKDVRKREKEALREEGRAAFEAGRSRQSAPGAYRHTMNLMHWVAGWDGAKQEHEARQQSSEEEVRHAP